MQYVYSPLFSFFLSISHLILNPQLAGQKVVVIIQGHTPRDMYFCHTGMRFLSMFPSPFPPSLSYSQNFFSRDLFYFYRIDMAGPPREQRK